MCKDMDYSLHFHLFWQSLSLNQEKHHDALKLEWFLSQFFRTVTNLLIWAPSEPMPDNDENYKTKKRGILSNFPPLHLRKPVLAF